MNIFVDRLGVGSFLSRECECFFVYDKILDIFLGVCLIYMPDNLGGNQQMPGTYF